MDVDMGGGVYKKVPMDLPSNSNKEKETKKKPKQEKIVSGRVKIKKQSIGRKFSEVFIGENMHSVGDYVIFEIAIPALKAMIADMGGQGLQRLLFGDERVSYRRGGTISTNSWSNHTSYDKVRTQGSYTRNTQKQSRASHDFNDIILDTRGEADGILDRLSDLIDTYDVATVADLYDLVGVDGEGYVDDKYGWNSPRYFGVKRIRDGYLLDLPAPEPIDS